MSTIRCRKLILHQLLVFPLFTKGPHLMIYNGESLDYKGETRGFMRKTQAVEYVPLTVPKDTCYRSCCHHEHFTCNAHIYSALSKI